MCIAFTRHEALADAALAQRGFHLRRDVDEAAAAGDVEPEFFAVAFHARASSR